MVLRKADAADYDEIIDLANLAYRGREGATPSWNIEKGIVGGQRLDHSLLREELAAKPDGALLIYREEADGPLLGTAWLNPEEDGVWSLGLLTIRPELQNQQLGRKLLDAVEDYARSRGAKRIRIGVLHVRDTLIAWYERRGYRATGDTEPYPADDPRFGTPLQDNLQFVIMEKQV
ncbi:MAG TPA: GNAT family N-acetyltransferase [Acidobacteriaceae bacterium]|nr:GNAT family N-acetyltransferase [Acidobacteriaceae bacterium]